MVFEELQKKINSYLEFSETVQMIRRTVIPYRYWNNYDTFNYYKEEYTLNQIKNFYKENCKLLFKKGKKFEEELYNSWSKSKYEKLVNMVISNELLKGENIDDILPKLSKIIKLREFNNNDSDDEELSDRVIFEELKEKLKIDHKNISKELNEKLFKNYVYKYIVPKAILNDWKGHFYTSEELKHIADLRYNSQEVYNLWLEYNKIAEMDFRELTINDIRKTLKRKIELMIIVMFFCWDKFKQFVIDDMTNIYNIIIQLENPSPCWLYLNSYTSILYAMANWKNEYFIDYQWIMSPFEYIPNIKPLLEMLK